MYHVALATETVSPTLTSATASTARCTPSRGEEPYTARSSGATAHLGEGGGGHFFMHFYAFYVFFLQCYIKRRSPMLTCTSSGSSVAPWGACPPWPGPPG